jgi:DNA-binding MarR family transcriptional regulator
VSLPPLSDEEVADFVLSLTRKECAMMQHFADERGRLYQAIADKAGVRYSEVQALAQKLQAARLAHVSVIPFDGSRLFLNDRGRSVKRAAGIIENMRVQSGNS